MVRRKYLSGGRATEGETTNGASVIGLRALSETGAVANFTREQIELFALTNMFSLNFDLNLECFCIDVNFSMGDSGFIAMLELVRLLFMEPRWEDVAFERAQQAHKAMASDVPISLEWSTLNNFMRLMYRNDPRMHALQVDDIDTLTLAKVRQAITAQLRPQDLEINFVGDFDGCGRWQPSAESTHALGTGRHHDTGDSCQVPVSVQEHRIRAFEETLWRYLGSMPPSTVAQLDTSNAPQSSSGTSLTAEERLHLAHLTDSEDRAFAIIGSSAPNRWGRGDAIHTEEMKRKNFSWDATGSTVKEHPLYPLACLLTLREVIGSRLYHTLRDTLGLAYDCNFDMSLFNRLEAGWFSCTVSSNPSQIKAAVEAMKSVLCGISSRQITKAELETSRRILISSHELQLQNNEYWLSILANLHGRDAKDAAFLGDIEHIYNQLTPADLNNAYRSLLTKPEQLFTAISTAGPSASFDAACASTTSV